MSEVVEWSVAAIHWGCHDILARSATGSKRRLVTKRGVNRRMWSLFASAEQSWKRNCHSQTSKSESQSAQLPKLNVLYLKVSVTDK